MVNQRRPLWLYPLFQIPAIFLVVFLVLALLFNLLGFGKPKVAVAVALDLSNSTYGSPVMFNKPNTVMATEVEAVKDYIAQNQELLKEPNIVKVLGFGERIRPLNSSFTEDSQKLLDELNKQLADPNLPNLIGGSSTNLSQAIESGTQELSGVTDRCNRELLIVTDGLAPVTSESMATALRQKVKINAIVVGAEAPDLRKAAEITNGLYLSGAQSSLSIYFLSDFFTRFNNNYRWIILWIGAAWIALMWMLVLPIDRWIFQDIFRQHWHFAGRAALSNALFWSALTPMVVWWLWQKYGIPGLTAC